MDEIDYGAAFGIEEPETTIGEEGTEPAEPSETGAAEPAAQGEEAQEAAAPAGDDTETAPEEGKGKTEEDSQYAAARRRAEADRDAAIAKAKADAQAEAQKTIDQFFRNSGLVNPYTKAPITTKAEYDAYRELFQVQQKQSVLQKTGMTQEEYKLFVENLPEVREAREAKETAEKAARAAREHDAKAKVEEQLREVQEMDPSIKSLQDLSKMETYPKLYEMVKKGYSIADAYKLANYDTLTTRAAAASRQAAVNAVQSKQHLNKIKHRGDGAVSVPDSVLEEYRVLNPGATKEDIQKHYQSYIKNTRKEK